MCDVFDYTNIVQKSYILYKYALQTLINVILTNKPNFCQNVSNSNCGLSDYHNMILFQLKGYVPKFKKEQDVARYVVLRIPPLVHLCQICIYLNTHYQKMP
jgi:hypothetical protein